MKSFNIKKGVVIEKPIAYSFDVHTYDIIFEYQCPECLGKFIEKTNVEYIIKDYFEFTCRCKKKINIRMPNF